MVFGQCGLPWNIKSSVTSNLVTSKFYILQLFDQTSTINSRVVYGATDITKIDVALNSEY